MLRVRPRAHPTALHPERVRRLTAIWSPCESTAVSAAEVWEGFGAALSAGWISRAGPVDMGGSLKVDILYVDAGGSRTLSTVTGNFIMGFSAP